MLEGRLTPEVAGDGSAVTFTFDVTNADDEPVGLVFPDAARADVAVTRDGEEVWRWSEGRMVAQVVSESTLQPGESATVELAWEEPAPGTYTARAELSAREHDCAAEATVTVPG
jgi:hypothetical protein